MNIFIGDLGPHALLWILLHHQDGPLLEAGLVQSLGLSYDAPLTDNVMNHPKLIQYLFDRFNMRINPCSRESWSCKAQGFTRYAYHRDIGIAFVGVYLLLGRKSHIQIPDYVYNHLKALDLPFNSKELPC